MVATPEQVALVKANLPSDAKALEADGGYGWTDEFIVTLMSTPEFDTPAKAVRHFWYQRTVETVEYLDAGKPLTQIHAQAKAMLEYWDLVINGGKSSEMIPTPEPARNTKAITFGEIERPWV